MQQSGWWLVKHPQKISENNCILFRNLVRITRKKSWIIRGTKTQKKTNKKQLPLTTTTRTISFFVKLTELQQNLPTEIQWFCESQGPMVSWDFPMRSTSLQWLSLNLLQQANNTHTNKKGVPFFVLSCQTKQKKTPGKDRFQKKSPEPVRRSSCHLDVQRYNWMA